VTRGRLYVGTSGFAYPAWVPKFYEPGKASRKLLPAYASRLPAVELNNTFYRRPADDVVARWIAATPEHFRFCPKAQRGTSWRALADDDPAPSIEWLLKALSAFGDKLGCVLLSARGSLQRDDAALARMLEAWPESVPLALELPHPTWEADEVHALIARQGAAIVGTDWDDRREPDLRRTGRFLYMRLRRETYSDEALQLWAERLEPFLADGMDAFVFFRHDDDGTFALHAQSLLERSERLAG
jgi:uncharacterized protein YecE (DUF72 family)